MERLIRYNNHYGFDKEWVEEFRKFIMLADISFYSEGGRECILKYKGKFWILTDNGGEFNLYFVNIRVHDSIPFMKNKCAVDAEELALDIIDIIKYDYKKSKKDGLEWRNKVKLTKY